MRVTRPLTSATIIALLMLLSEFGGGTDSFVASGLAQSSECSTGTAVTDPANNSGLVADCEVLLEARDTLQGSASLNWSVDIHIQEWSGITVRGSPPRVRAIELGGMGLNGRIPPALGSLDKLVYLTLTSNPLTGGIPTEIGNLTNLKYLQVHGTQLSGPIPPALGRLSNLDTLSITGSQLGGQIPAELSNLSRLRRLGLDNNQLRGPIPPELGDLSNLRYLFLSTNRLSGPIPLELGKLHKLEWL